MLTTPLAVVLLAQFVSAHAPDPVSSGAGLAWDVPKAWTAAPVPSSMRLATYRAPAVAGDPEGPEIAVFYFGQGQGGSVDSNVERWLSQIARGKGDAREEARKHAVRGLTVTTVASEGTYASGMPGGPTTPRPGWALVGAIAEGPEGAIFFKMTGPKKSVAKERAAFEALVASLRRVTSA